MIRQIIGVAFIALGAAVMFIAILGLFRFRYVLNRMHAAAVGDSLGLFLILIGLMLLSGWQFKTLKLLFIMLIVWIANPVMSHLVARAEVRTHSHIQDECEVIEDDHDGDL